MPLKRGGALIMNKYNLSVTRRMIQVVWWWYAGFVVYAGSVYITTKKNWKRRHSDLKYWGYQKQITLYGPFRQVSGVWSGGSTIICYVNALVVVSYELCGCGIVTVLCQWYAVVLCQCMWVVLGHNVNSKSFLSSKDLCVKFSNG